MSRWRFFAPRHGGHTKQMDLYLPEVFQTFHDFSRNVVVVKSSDPWAHPITCQESSHAKHFIQAAAAGLSQATQMPSEFMILL